MVHFDDNMQTSVKINDDEVKSLYNEGVSGFWADQIDLAGDGIGMSTVSTLMDLNEGDVTIVPNVNEYYNVTIDNVPYERNQIILEVKKAVTNKW